MTPLTYLKQRANDDWLIGYSSQEFFALTSQILQELERRSSTQTPLTILLAERSPLRFLAYFIAACIANCTIVLANPDWGAIEWQQVFELVQPDLVWGEVEEDAGTRRRGDAEMKAEGGGQRAEGETRGHGDAENLDPIQNSKFKIQNSPQSSTQNSKLKTSSRSPHLPTSHSPLPTSSILIPTGGTSGKIRFAIHTWETLIASVQGFRQYFDVNQVNSFCVLPLYHVSGLMQCLRSFTSGGKLVILPFKSVEAGNLSDIDPAEFFLSLVPTQLQRLLCSPNQLSSIAKEDSKLKTQNSKLKTQNFLPWLSRFHTVLLGGAPAWSELLETARQHQIRLAPTYGMTETASQIVTLKPCDFLRGQTGCGQVLPHAQVRIQNSEGKALDCNQTGIISIRAKSLCLSYYPKADDFQPNRTTIGDSPLKSENVQFQETLFQPDDLGFFDAQGYLHIVGRSSDKMITGGENVFSAEVEAAIRATDLVKDVCVIGVSDRRWGEAISAIYVPISPSVSPAALQTALANKLSKFKYPKHWLAVEQLPRNAQGKVNREQAKTMIQLKVEN